MRQLVHEEVVYRVCGCCKMRGSYSPTHKPFICMSVVMESSIIRLIYEAAR